MAEHEGREENEEENVTNTQIATPSAQRSIVAATAAFYGMEPGPFEQTLRATVFPANGTREQFAAFLIVAKNHNLNPVTREMFAFPTKGGGIAPVVSVDGWLKLINCNPAMDGLTFVDETDDKGNLVSVTANLYRKDREHPISVTEYLAECKRDTDTWRQWPKRMLRHKATIQAARYAFGFAGIYDIDEAERMKNIQGAGLGGGTWEEIAPAENDDTSGQFLNGEVADLLRADYIRQMSACTTLEELAKVWKSFHRRYYNNTRKRISDAFYGGLEEEHARIEEKLSEQEFEAHQAKTDITAHIAAKTPKTKAAQRRARKIVKRK
jgi:phage recombination protein Bet